MRSVRPSPENQTLNIKQSIDIALQHHSAGRLPQAESIYQQILQIDPNQPVALHLLGVIAHQVGKNDIAVEFITRALAVKPDYAEAHVNLGNSFKELGRVEEAAASYRKALGIRRDFAEAHYNLGSALKELGRLDEAVESYNRALSVKPDYAEAHNNLGNALHDLGQLEDAIASYHKALAIEPDNTDAHNNLGNTLYDLGRMEDAVTSCRNALDIEPNHLEANINLGNALKELGQLDEAMESYQKALAIKSDYAEAYYNICEVLEKTNQTEALRKTLDEARRNCPDSSLFALKEAQLLKRDGDFAAARVILEVAGGEMVDTQFPEICAHLLGELCDRLDDTDAAFNYFREGNRLNGDTHEAKRADRRNYVAWIDLLQDRFSSEWTAGWRNLESDDDRPDPVFLVGFPRSGTTLLDTVLRSHKAISVVEERPTVQFVRNSLQQLPGGCPDGLAELDQAHLAELRQVYFSELDKYLEPEDRSAVVIDKMPLNIVEAGLIHRIFPQARFLFAERHPCDCVLSCFMQGFKINDAMANFLDLEDAARLYDKVMTLWQQYQTVLPLQVYSVRYENLIDEFEETLTRLLDFLGLDWDDGIRNYAETAYSRAKINTPSYDQVTEPLYTHARGRWHRYHEHMQPVLPILLPWAQRFGYGI